MGSLFSDFVENLSTGNAVNTNGGSVEFQLSRQRLLGYVRAVLSAPASLTAGFMLLEMQISDGTWVGCPQRVCITASGSGTPNVINGNTATATGLAGGSVVNTTGITTITDTITAIFVYEAYGRPIRIRYGASGGTAVLAVEENGLLAV